MTTFTNDWITESAKILFRGATPPEPTKFRLCLANTATLTRGSSLVDFISNELLPNDGYIRAAANFSADGNYDPTDQRHEMPTITASFTADGASLQFQAAFLMADARVIASRVFSDANVNPATDVITINNHGFIPSDRLIFTADELAFLPGGIAAGTIYTVTAATTNTFGIGVDITNTGSGTFRARSANGIVVAFATADTPITLADGQTYSYQIPLVVLNSGYVSGS